MPDATAMAVRNGTVAWLGSDDIGRAQFPDATVTDLDGAFVAPAFVDSHVHTTSTGLALTGLDLRGANSLRHCLELLANYARSHPDGVIWGHGWDESGWPEQSAPSTADVDATVGDRLAYLARVDVHSAAASTPMRRVARVADGEALTADAHHRVRRAARERLTATQRTRARIAALDTAAALGIVAVHECAGPDIGGLDDWQELRTLDHGVEVVGYWGEQVGTAEEAGELMAVTQARGLAGDLFVDGAIGSRTAWLHEPYADIADGCAASAASRGNAYLDADAVTAHLSACTEAGVTAGFHVIGDAAVATVTAALGTVVDRFGVAAVARCGHRLEHLEMVTEEQAAKLGSCGVIASMQPNFDALWGGETGMYAQRLGVSRAAGLNRFALLASQGVPLAFGSDSPVTDLNPWATVRSATTHRTPGSAISARAAFAASTRGAWRAGGVRDGLMGTLVPGAPASYAVWDADGFDVSAPTDAVARWSTDPRSRVPVLPALTGRLPQCLQTVHRGRVLHG
ncbi:amidohydrolase family protein [Mycobacterium sp. 236(2023)]|uniref:amidohydrolase n=1 Tax=Mycobacterium sp. 236(2023) TaxID=3038163 RepID=UPI0024151F8A|nr:amidohydrolase family protein [Mycobacterium sp. 236(2023)]MDG4666601.1 amidohydrolase family protein [Mycobacterium sp. 236(2023)]